LNVPEKYRTKPARVGYGLGVLKLSLFLNRFFKTPVNPDGLIPWWGPILPQNIVFHSWLIKFFPKKKIALEDLEKLEVPPIPKRKSRLEKMPIITTAAKPQPSIYYVHKRKKKKKEKKK